MVLGLAGLAVRVPARAALAVPGLMVLGLAGLAVRVPVSPLVLALRVPLRHRQY